MQCASSIHASIDPSAFYALSWSRSKGDVLYMCPKSIISKNIKGNIYTQNGSQNRTNAVGGATVGRAMLILMFSSSSFIIPYRVHAITQRQSNALCLKSADGLGKHEGL